MTIAVLGSTGYVGQVLMRILSSHSKVTKIIPVSRSRVGEHVLEVDPGLSDFTEDKLSLSGGKYTDTDFASTAKPDAVFSALPHLASVTVLNPFFGHSVVIDLSADMRISDQDIFTQAYGEAPPRPDLLQKAVYGLSEWFEADISRTDIIANPGCYPTATLIPLLPLIAENLVGGAIVVNAMSGISGAGRKAKEHLLYTSRTENATAYNPGRRHRHWQEISFHASAKAQEQGTESSPEIYFTPHLIPVHQGMAVTTSLPLKKDMNEKSIEDLFRENYENSPFVRIRKDIPETSQVRGTNRCDFTWRLDGRRLTLLSVIDNLYKGAAGQAVQNLNIRFGFDQRTGLDLHGEL